MSKPQTMIISCESGLVARRPSGTWFPLPQRFYNWPADLKPGEPAVGVAFSREVPCDDWHMRLAYSGAVNVEGPEEAIRAVDRYRRDKQLQTEASIGWDRKPSKKQRKQKAAPKADKPKKEID